LGGEAGLISLLEQRTISQNQGCHGFDNWDRPWHDTRIMSAFGLQQHGLAVVVDRFLWLADGGRWFEGDSENNRTKGSTLYNSQTASLRRRASVRRNLGSRTARSSSLRTNIVTPQLRA